MPYPWASRVSVSAVCASGKDGHFISNRCSYGNRHISLSGMARARKEHREASGESSDAGEVHDLHLESTSPPNCRAYPKLGFSSRGNGRAGYSSTVWPARFFSSPGMSLA